MDRTCIDCDTSLAHRNVRAKLCAPCREVRDRGYQRKYRATPKGRAKKARENSSEAMRGYQAKYKAPAKGRAKRAAWVAAGGNAEAVGRYRKTPRGRATKRLNNSRRRAREVNATVEPLPLDLELQLLKSQAEQCYLCHEELENFHLEHKTPLARGGAHSVENLALACGPCNLSKGTQTHAEVLFG